jgi:hypothetical protein
MDHHREQASDTVASEQSCQICGAATRGDEPLCDSCAAAAGAIVETPLPPIPDGGLSRVMPDWLRSGPRATTAETTLPPQPAPNEFASILSDEDIPVWLKRMAERHAADRAPAAVPTQTHAPAASSVQAASSGTANPPAAPAGEPEHRVMDGATLPPPNGLAPSTAPPSRRMRVPTTENRTAIGVGILAAIAAFVILAMILFG